MAEETSKAMKALEELRQDSKLCKDRHFAAAERKFSYHVWFGVPVVIANVFIGSVLVELLKKPNPETWITVTASLLSFLAASLSGVQTFLNFHKAAEGHRSVANKYLEISRKCKHLLLKQKDDPVPITDLWSKIEEITQAYSEVNITAEAFPTSDSDFKKAKAKIMQSVTPVETS
jgi:hypothetical protein